MIRRHGDDGYAMVAAIAALAVFGYIAFAMLAAERGHLADVAATRAQARLAAAADGALVLAAERLRTDWRIDSRVYRETIDGVAVTLRIEDERGKIRLNQLTDDQVRRMFEAADAPPMRVAALTDAFLDWRDGDDERRADGAERDDYARRGIMPRNGNLHSVGELAFIAGLDRRTFDRIAPAATVFFGTGSFSPETAQPLAIAVMTEAGEDSPEAIERQRALAGQRTALEFTDRPDLRGRPLTVRIRAEDGDGGRLEQATIIEYPAGASGPWTVRYRD